MEARPWYIKVTCNFSGNNVFLWSAMVSLADPSGTNVPLVLLFFTMKQFAAESFLHRYISLNFVSLTLDSFSGIHKVLRRVLNLKNILDISSGAHMVLRIVPNLKVISRRSLQQSERSDKTSWQDLQFEKDFCDVTMACEDEQFQAHKMVISSSNPLEPALQSARSRPASSESLHPCGSYESASTVDFVSVHHEFKFGLFQPSGTKTFQQSERNDKTSWQDLQL